MLDERVYTMKKMETILACKYGPMDPKVNLLPDFFTGFEASQRKKIVTEEAFFYKELTAPYSVDVKIKTRYIHFRTKDNAEIAVKVYEPRNMDRPMPVVMFFHGGGFITCSVETHNYVSSFIACNANVVVCSVEYRLAPEHKFPTGLEDCYEAIKWVIANKNGLNVNISRLMVCGDSSGANFSAVLCLMAKERKEFQIANQILIYPVTDLSGTVNKKSIEVYGSVGKDSAHGKGVDIIAAYTNPSDDLSNPYISPILAEDVTGLPPALFIEAECDALVDDGLMYAKRLKDSGVLVICEIYEGMPHAFILRTYEETFKALNDICDYILKF